MEAAAVCGICEASFNENDGEPKASVGLPCDHRFCLECFTAMAQKANDTRTEIKCPICEPLIVEEVGKNNNALMDLIGSLAKMISLERKATEENKTEEEKKKTEPTESKGDGGVKNNSEDSVIPPRTWFSAFASKRDSQRSLLDSKKTDKTEEEKQAAIERNEEKGGDALLQNDKKEEQQPAVQTERIEAIPELEDKFESLLMDLSDWINASKELEKKLMELKEEMTTHHKNSHIAKVGGHSAAAVGGVLAVAGVATSFFTFGTSLTLTAAGIALGSAGGATSAGSALVEWRLLNKLMKKADGLFSFQAERTAALSTKLHSIEAEVCAELSRRRIGVIEGSQVVMSAGSVLWNVGNLTYKTASTTSTFISGVSVGLSGAATGGKFLLNGGVPLLGAASTTATSLAVVGGVVSIVLIPVDIASAGWSVYKIAVGSIPEKAEELQKLIDILHKNIHQVEEALSNKDFQALLQLFPVRVVPVSEELLKDNNKEKQKEEEEEKREEGKEKPDTNNALSTTTTTEKKYWFF